MGRQGSQQTVWADRGGVIENVTQIIQGSKPDVAFSRDSAHRVPNRIHREFVLALVRSALAKYFWRPSDLGNALLDVEVQRWNVPLWRLHGKVSASWTKMVEEVVGKTEDQELTQWVPRQDSTIQDVDWLVPAYRSTNIALRELSEAILVLDRSRLPVRVDWRGYPFGESLEHIWPNLKAVFGGSLWRKNSIVAHASTLFEGPLSASDQGREKAKEPVWLPELEPEVSLLTAIERADRQIEDCLRSWASKSTKRLQDFEVRLDVDSVEQYYFPIWVVQYTYQDSQHSAVVNGYNGRLINALLPLSLRAGVIAWCIPTLVLGVPFWPLAAYLLYQSLSFPLGGLLSYIMPLLFALIPFMMTGSLAAVWWIQRNWLSQ